MLYARLMLEMRDDLSARHRRFIAEMNEIQADAARLESESAALRAASAENWERYWRVTIDHLIAIRDELLAAGETQPEALARIDAMIAAATDDHNVRAPLGGRVAVPPRLTGIAAVRAVLQEEPQREWRPRDVHGILRERGWVSGAKSGVALTESALNRLWRQTGEVERPQPGRYRWKGDPAA
jgi:hypothetical protein